MQISPVIEDKFRHIISRTHDCFLYFLIFLWISITTFAIITCIYGLVSWILIPKWRKFHNYVFQNIIFSGSLHLLTPFALAGLGNCYFCIFFQTVFNHWLIIATAMFYIDFVKIFNNSIKYRYLKANLFAWILPILVTLMIILLRLHGLYFGIATSCFNFLLYLRVLFALFKSESAIVSTANTKLRLGLIATLAFLTTGLVIYLPVIVMIMIDDHQHNDLGVLGYLLVNLVSVTLICVYFWMMKYNKEAWKEFIYMKKARKLKNNNFQT